MNKILVSIVTVLFIAYSCYACELVPNSVTVQKAADAALANPDPLAKFTAQDIENHFNEKTVTFGHNLHTTFACVDARENIHSFGTPGGDFVEFAAALYVYFNMTQTAPTQAVVRSLFRDFVDSHCSAERPFYYHTDYSRLQTLFANIATRTGSRPSIFPWNTPENANIWYEELVKSEVQGCGHLRLMLANPATYGMDDATVPEMLLQEFIRYWWESSDEEKQKFDFVTKLGTLTGKAVTIVSSTSEDSQCKNYSPMVIPNIRGSSTFVYHASAVTSFREQVLAPFFASKSSRVNIASFNHHMKSLTDTQLGATLSATGLSPANQVDLFSVSMQARSSATTFTVSTIVLVVTILLNVVFYQ